MTKILLPFLLFSMASLPCMAAAVAPAHTEHGASASISAPPAQKPDREKVWRNILAQPSLATSVAFDASGRLWRVQAQAGHIRISYSDDRGKRFSTPAVVNEIPEHIAGDGENRPKILLRNDVIYLSWTQALDKPMTGHIRFSRSTDGGKTFSPPVTVNDNPEIISHRFEAMGVNDRGQVYLAWLDKRDLSAAQKEGRPYTGAAVYYAVSDDNGVSFRPNRKLADHSCECCRVAMAMGPDGVPVVFWRHIFGKNTRDFALARLDEKAILVRATHDNWQVDGCPHHGGAISIGSDGAYHMVWFNNGPERHGLFYGTSTDSGRTFSTSYAFGNEDAQAGHPDVLSLGKRIFVVWKEFDGKEASAQGMLSSDGGSSWSAPRRLAATAGASDHPLLISHQDKAYLSWQTEKDGLRLLEIVQP